MLLTQNKVDPSKTLKIRKSFSNAQRRLFKTAVSQSNQMLATFPDNPTQNQIEDYKAALLMLLMTPLIQGSLIYPHVQSAYLRGVTNANHDLRAGGLRVDGAALAVLTQASHRFSLAAKQDQTQAMIRQIYAEMVFGIGNEFGIESDISTQERVNKQLRKGMNLAITVGTTAIVGIVADAFLNRVVDFGIALVSPIIEAKFTTQGDDRVCELCQDLETKDIGNGPGIYTINQARGVIPAHWGCRCNWSIVVLGKQIPIIRI